MFVLKDFVALGYTDINELVEKNLNDVSDWERNFRAIKTQGRETEKLPK